MAADHAKPRPPASIPQYVREGVERQDASTLRDLARWADALADHYDREIEADELAGEGEAVLVNVESSSDGTTVIKKVSCGKENCKCQDGELHGPYKYVVRREGDSVNWEYKGKVGDG